MTNRLVTKVGKADEEQAAAFNCYGIHEPTVASTYRTKGNLYAIAEISGEGPLARQAGEIGIETLRNEYYYDLSAGIPICLRKAMRVANRRVYNLLKSKPEAGQIKINLSSIVIRDNELYLGQVGNARTYLFREGKLLSLPSEEEADTAQSELILNEELESNALYPPSTPLAMELQRLGEEVEIEPEIWRGSIEAGNIVVLAAEHLSRVLGPSEIKKTLTTLRPQQAAEHLQNLFLAKRSPGSSACLIVEVSEVAAAEPVIAPEPIAPGKKEAAEAKVGVGRRAGAGRLGQFVESLASLPAAAITAVANLFPGRRAAYGKVSGPRTRKTILPMLIGGILVSALVVLAVVLVVVFSQSPRGVSGEMRNKFNAAMSAAEEKEKLAEQLLAKNDIVGVNSALKEAQEQVEKALQTHVDDQKAQALQEKIKGQLDKINNVVRLKSVNLKGSYSFGSGANPSSLVSFGDEIYVCDQSKGTVYKFSGKLSGQPEAVYSPGHPQGAAEAMATTVSEDGLLVLDKNRAIWRFNKGEWSQVEISGASDWTEPEGGHWVVAAFGSNFYVLDRGQGQILRYRPTLQGYTSPPEGYLAEAVGLKDAVDLQIDGDVYVLFKDGGIRKFRQGQQASDFQLIPPFDRPVTSAVSCFVQQPLEASFLFVVDAKGQRILQHDKNGGFVQQLVFEGRENAFSDLKRALVVSGEGKMNLYVTSGQSIYLLEWAQSK